MAPDHNNRSRHEDTVASCDGSATQRLRETEKASAVSRRGVLWRTGLATAAGAAALTVLDEHRADAATGGNFILGQSNDATSATTLAPPAGVTTSFSLLMKFDGSVAGVTKTTVEIDGPPVTGGVALTVNQATTSGYALSVNGRTYFSRSGAGYIKQGNKTRTMSISGLTTASLVLVTLQTYVSGIYIAAAVPGLDQLIIHLNNNTPVQAKFAWFVLN